MLFFGKENFKSQKNKNKMGWPNFFPILEHEIVNFNFESGDGDFQSSKREWFGTMVIVVKSMMETWEQRIKDRKGSIEIEVTEDMHIIAVDTISRTSLW